MGSSIRRLHRKWTAPLGALVALAALVFTVAALPMRASADQGQIDLDLVASGAQHSATATPDSDGVIHITATVVIGYGGGDHLTPGGTLTVGAHADAGVTALTPSDASPLSLPVPGTWGSGSSATWTVPISFRGIADGVAHTYHVWLDINSACVNNQGASVGRDCVTGADVLLITATTPAAGGGAGGAGGVDTTAPVITVPANITTEATGPSGAAVTYVATATDNIDGSLTPTCSPASGSTFPLGTTTVTCTATDAAGNTSSGSFTVTVQDTTPPVITCGSADGAWHADNVTINCTSHDAVSGDTSFTLTTTVAAGQETDNASTGTHEVCDLAGHCVTAGPVTGNKIDRKAPSLSGSRSPGANSAGWNNGTVTVTFACTDDGSGFGTNASHSVSLSGQGAGQSAASGDCTDAVGNVASSITVGDINIDLTIPTIGAAPTTSANSNGWYNHDVTVHYTCADDLSGVASCPTDEILSSTGSSSSTAKATDKAGNESAAVTPVSVQIDKVAPTFTCDSADGAWHASNVSITCTASDGGSGLANPGDTSFTLTTTVAAGQETDNASTGTHEVCDLAGNCVTAGPVTGNRIDRKAPSLSGSRSPIANSAGWNNGTVTVTFVCTDDGSGFGTDASHSVSLSGQGAGQSAASGDCTDAVGNVASSITVDHINIDTTNPTVSAAATTAANANGWYNHDVTVHYTCDDNLSGVASCPTDEVLAATGSSSSTATATDKAGNVSDPANVVSVKIDKLAPTVAQGPITALGSLGTCTATDDNSGIDGTYSQTGAYTVDGSGIHYTVTCTAKDKAGNAATPSAVTYTVRAAAACTFMQPITTPITVFNTGSTIPLKVICKNAAGVGFQVPGLSMTVTVTGPAATSMTNVNMPFSSDHYQANWNTLKTQGVGTYTVTVNFNDGSTLTTDAVKSGITLVK